LAISINRGIANEASKRIDFGFGDCGVVCFNLYKNAPEFEQGLIDYDLAVL